MEDSLQKAVEEYYQRTKMSKSLFRRLLKKQPKLTSNQLCYKYLVLKQILNFGCLFNETQHKFPGDWQDRGEFELKFKTHDLISGVYDREILYWRQSVVHAHGLRIISRSVGELVKNLPDWCADEVAVVNSDEYMDVLRRTNEMMSNLQMEFYGKMFHYLNQDLLPLSPEEYDLYC